MICGLPLSAGTRNLLLSSLPLHCFSLLSLSSPLEQAPKRKRKRASEQHLLPDAVPGTSSRSHPGGTATANTGTATTTGTHATATTTGAVAAAAGSGGAVAGSGGRQRQKGHGEGGRKLMIQDVRGGGGWTASDLVGREVAVPAPLLHKRGGWGQRDILHFMICHSKKCIGPTPQAVTENSEVEQRGINGGAKGVSWWAVLEGMRGLRLGDGGVR